MEKMGYTSSYAILNAKDFGTPQSRPRLYVVSYLGDKSFQFPVGTRASECDITKYLDFSTTFEEYALSENEKALFFEMDGNLFVREATKLGYKLVEEFDVINVERPNSKTRRGRVGKRMANTLTTSPKQVVYYDGKLRYLTALEHTRLMEYTDADYYLMKDKINDTKISYLMGNSIVVTVLEEIFKEVFNQFFME